MRSINRVENRRFRIERNIAADRQRRLVRIPDIARAAGSVSADAKRRMMVRNTQTQPISRTQKLVFICQFESRVEIVSIEKLQSGFCHISVQVKNISTVTFMIAAPDQTRGPVATFYASVITD